MSKYSVLTLIIYLLVCAGCNNTNSNREMKMRVDIVQSLNSDSFPSKELLIEKSNEEGWGADIRLSIIAISKTDTSVTYATNSLYDKKNVGFNITIPTTTPKSEKELAQVLTLESDGDISDNFIQMLSKLYKQEASTTVHFVPSKRVAFIDLDEFAKTTFGTEPVNKKVPVKEMKVFFESENPDYNAELYININESEHWVEIKEKDEDYRKQVIKGLTVK